MKINIDTAHEIIEHHFGKAPKELIELEGGFANFVFHAKVDSKKYIVRISDHPSKLQSFIKEQWAVKRAAEKKVPVPEILEVANEASKFPYMIQEFVEAKPALSCPSSERFNIIRQMGRQTALINEIQTSGYGHFFDWSENRLSHNDSWIGYLDRELEVSERIAFLQRQKILDQDQILKLKNTFKDIRKWNVKPHLNHGDIRLKNILLGEDGKICSVLDWEMCLSNVTPQWDLSIALHDLSIDEKAAFIEGYGLSQKEYRNRSQSIKAFNIINYTPYLERAYEEGDEKSKEYVDQMKTRLRGDFDLYTFS